MSPSIEKDEQAENERPAVGLGAKATERLGPELGVGLLGCGVVGSAVVRALTEDADRLADRIGRRPSIRAIAVKHLGKERPPWVPRRLLTADAHFVVERDDVDVVVEAIGGINPAGGLIELALHRGKDVVTANKELLARRWDCLHHVARGKGRTFRYEASVMAGVPVMDALTRLGAGDRVLSLEGILNGTTNYCLHRMEEGVDLPDALEEARAMGFAELDPSADVEGRDAAAKLAILATLAFGRTVTLDQVSFAGIGSIRPGHVLEARRHGFALRLLAEASLGDGGVVARVAPRTVPLDHPLAAVPDQRNGVVVNAELAGGIFIQGPGAGGDATASAIIADILQAS